MNAITKAVSQGDFAGAPAIPFNISRSWLFALFFVVFATAISLVYVKDLNRRLFIQYQNLEQQSSQINTNYGKLLLEKGAWDSQAHVQNIAEQRLNMEVPTAKQVVMVKM